jgi:alkanesulfonate monooxygenase SsuD/methylene tetrahydromethanopterin reductase-like flavin-dependent oxidoreductase (luciferase family)
VGWLFVWDHVVFPVGGVHEVADPWVLLTVMAMATERIRLGPLVTPVARRLDEGLDLLAGLWSGQPVDFHGREVTAADVTFLPTPVQRPRPPVWIGCNWPARPPLRRAARWDGVAPMVVNPRDGALEPTPAIVAEIAAAVAGLRDGTGPFDVVITGRTVAAEKAAAADLVGSASASARCAYCSTMTSAMPRAANRADTS